MLGSHIDVAGILLIIGSYLVSPQVADLMPAKYAGIVASVGGVLVAVGTYVKNNRTQSIASTIEANTKTIDATAKATGAKP